jgi:hypothetical protein
MNRRIDPTANDTFARDASTLDDGYGLHPIVRCAAVATPSQWIDSLVTSVARDGWLELTTLDGETLRRWHHEDLGEVLATGSPVAVHAQYGVLAHGETLWSVRAA